MRSWRMAKDRCYLCGIVQGGQYPFVLEETDDKGNPISREVASAAKMVEIKRRFDKNNEVIYYICTRCKLLTIIEDEREYFRFAFKEETLKPIKALDLIKWANDLSAKVEKVGTEVAKINADKEALKVEAPKEDTPKYVTPKEELSSSTVNVEDNPNITTKPEYPKTDV